MTSDPQRLGGTELEQSKRERLQYTVEYAYEHSPFYRDLMDDHAVAPDDIRTVDDLRQLPVVSGDDILANQPPETDRFRFKNPAANVRRPFATSGTDGRPKTVFMSYDDVAAFYAGTGRRGFEHFGLTADDTLLNYNPFVGLNPSCVYVEAAVETIGGTTIPISNTPYPTPQELALIRNHDPDVLMGLASHLATKGRTFEHEGVDPATFDLDAVFTAGEPLGDERRHHISDMYDAPVRRFYAATEVGGIAFDCLETEGYHVLDGRYHVEILDEDGDPCPAGERGAVVVTKLYEPGEDAAMPLLRYAVGDVASVAPDEGCDCALAGGTRLHAPTLSKWEFVVAGVNLSTTFIEDVLYGDEELAATLEEYQVHLSYDTATGRDVCTVVVTTSDDRREEATDVTRETQADSLAATIGHRLLDAHSHLHDTVATVDAARLDIDVVDEIDLGKGKPDRIIDTREQ